MTEFPITDFLLTADQCRRWAYWSFCNNSTWYGIRTSV